jgi:N-acetylneuraminate synthase
MSHITLRNGRRVGDYLKPYIVAELNTSHFGDLNIAKKMIDQAKLAGCDCVKFQSWSPDTLYSEGYYQENKITKRVVTKFSLGNDQLKELSSYALEKKIDFASTPYSIEEAKFLVEECNVPFVKIASMELNNLKFLEQLALLGVPLVLSTGMGTLEEIIAAVGVIESVGNDQLIILHCTSVYPAPPEIIRLQNIVGLRGEFPGYPIGYSDHSQGIEIPAASIALGACLVERHFTLDSARIGMDNQMATEPEEMRILITACHKVYYAMGGFGRILGAEEKGQISKMRRSMVSKVDIEEGCALSEEKLEFKRPGNGISPTDLPKFIGMKTNKFIKAGSTIATDDLVGNIKSS